MDSLKVPLNKNLTAALKKLEEAINNYEKLKSMGTQKISILMENEKLQESLRDSLIQRFEFCVDLFWKYLDKYLKHILKIVPEATAPKSVIKAACKARILLEQDASILLEMIDGRNMTSHIYKEEIADQLSRKIPAYYHIMLTYTKKLGE